MTEQRVATLIVEVEGRQTNLEQLLRRVHADLLKARGEADKTSQSNDKLGGSQRRAANESLLHAQALARLAVAEGDTAAAAQILQRELATQTERTRAVIAAETQLANTKRRLANESSGAAQGLRGLGQAASGLQTALGAVGLAFGIEQVVAFGAAAVNQANQLEQIDAVLRVTAGSAERYDEIMAIATANQRALGGTMAENLAPMSAFMQLSNRTGAELRDLNDAAQLLLASNPAAGIGDASFALSEFLSNNNAEAALSLADRFNLNKAALTALAAEGTTAQERLAGLEQLLAQQGITVEALNARLNTTAATYNSLGATVSNVTGQIGSVLAQALEPAARGADVAAQGLGEFLSILTGGTGQIAKAQQEIAASAGSYEEYRARAEAAAAAGQAHADSVAAQFGPLAGLASALAGAVTGTEILSEAEYNQAVAAQQAAAGTQEHTDAATDLEGQAAVTAATLDLVSLAAADEDAALRQAAAAAYEQVQAGATLEEQARAAAQALLEAGGAGEGAAARLAQSSSDVDQLTAAYYRLLAAQQAAGAGSAGTGGLGGLGAGLGSARDATTRIRARIDSQIRLSNPPPRPPRGGGGSGRSGGGAGSADREREQELAAERKFQEQRLQDQQRIASQIEDAEQEHRDNLLDIQEEYESRSLELQRKGEIDKRKTRESFYEALINSDLDAGQQQGLSAQYEAANARAEELAQQGKQAQSQAYRALKAEQLKAELEYLEAVKKARDEGDTDQLAKLEAIAALRRDREQAELNDLEQQGDAPTNERDQALAEEGQRYADAQAEIGLAAEEAARRKVEATTKSTDALALETAQIKANADALLALNAQRGSAGLTTPATTPTPAAAAATPTAAPTADPAAALASGSGGPVQVTDPRLDDVVRRLDGIERGIRSLGNIRNISPGS